MLIDNGVALESFYGYNGVQKTDHVLIPANNSGIVAFKADLTGRSKVIASFVASGGSNGACECFSVVKDGVTFSTLDVPKNSAIVKKLVENTNTNTYTDLELDVSSLNGIHQIVISTYTKQIKITELKVV